MALDWSRTFQEVLAGCPGMSWCSVLIPAGIHGGSYDDEPSRSSQTMTL